jgi:hypothetical protein
MEVGRSPLPTATARHSGGLFLLPENSHDLALQSLAK